MGEKKIKKVLGIDYGKKRIGLAIGIADNKIIVPFGILKNKENFLNKLNQVIKEESIDLIVVGLPIALKTTSNENEQLKTVKDFVSKLKKVIKKPIVFFDERLSSKVANTLTRDLKGKRDDVAAQIILQDYLEKNYF